MNAIGGVIDAEQELEYVLEVPVDHATALQDKLMLTGVPERCIRVARPSRHAQVSQSDTGPEPNDYQPSRAKPFTRFLPGAIKLGTYAEGMYNVTIRRRPLPEGRETVCISLSSPSAAEQAAEVEIVTAEKIVTPGRDDQQHSANQSRSVMDGGGGGGVVNDDDGEPVTIPICHCDDTECENYRMRVCEYFANSGTNYTNVCGATDCVHKQIVDALKLTESSSTDRVAPADTVETTAAPTAAATNGPAKRDVPAQPRTADPGPRSVKSRNVANEPKPVTRTVPADDTAVKKKKWSMKKKVDSRKDDGHSCPTNVNSVCDCKTVTGNTGFKNVDASLKTAKLNPRS
ncbi:Hypothetical protein CINCED_3A008537 [Cinara cedri]|uniref:Uncharacterized protein n=1 Tax=Cinara cedri TaxID=506608 RepID=A0A5E4NQW6_9HEMI|nr:Hypothetical protein CINCED_3A008537 [Cinara cedri]